MVFHVWCYTHFAHMYTYIQQPRQNRKKSYPTQNKHNSGNMRKSIGRFDFVSFWCQPPLEQYMYVCIVYVCTMYIYVIVAHRYNKKIQLEERERELRVHCIVWLWNHWHLNTHSEQWIKQNIHRKWKNPRHKNLNRIFNMMWQWH